MVHFEVLIEDQSGSMALEVILEKILGANAAEHSWRIHSYRGAGHIPKDLRGVTDPRKRILLDRLPSLLRGYGKSLRDPSSVVVIVDLDNRDCMAFKQELLNLLKTCDPCPRALFRIAIEESEAWLLGDRDAVKTAYPRAKDAVLDSYVQDSVCGTWEILADAIHPGGASRLKSLGYREAGEAKRQWAEEIAPRMNVDGNQSVSFRVFRDGLRALAGTK